MRRTILVLFLFVLARAEVDLAEDIAGKGEEEGGGPHACVRDPTFEDDPVEEAARVEARALCLARCVADNKPNITCETVTCSEEEIIRTGGSRIEFSSLAAPEEAGQPGSPWITAPRLLCRTHDSLVVTWTATGAAAAPDVVFVVTARAWPGQTGAPRRHIFTKDTNITLSTLVSGDMYQFRLQAMRKDGWVQQACDSKWISTFNDTQTPLPVRNLSASVIDFTRKNVTMGIQWEPAEDKVCVYRIIYWNPRDAMVPLKTDMPKKVFWAHLKDLAFNSVYEVYISSEVILTHHTLESEKVGINITTPSCLELFENNLDICSPPPPKRLNITFLMTDVDQYEMECSWTQGVVIPRSYTAYVTQIDHGANWSRNKTVSGNITKVNFQDISPDRTYRVCVRAESRGGNSSRECDYRIFKKPRREESGRNLLIIIIVLTIILLMSIVMYFLYYRHSVKRRERKKRSQYFEGRGEGSQEPTLDTSLTNGIYNFSSLKNLDKELPQEKEDLSLTYSDEWEIPSERLELECILGEGAFGVVHKGVLRGQTPSDPVMEVAVKMLRDEPTQDDLRQFKQEINMMKSVGKHPHIVSIIGCCTATRHAQLIVEYCALGDLRTYLHKTSYEHMSPPAVEPAQSGTIKYAELMTLKDNSYETDAKPEIGMVINQMYFHKNEEPKSEHVLTSVDLLSFARQIAMGMDFLASNRIVHRDLAARNVLVCADKTVKICDFGLSRDIYEQNVYRKTGDGKLPIKWMAIESLLYHVYTTQSDIWSFGILLWEIVTMGGVPYPGTPARRVFELLKTGYRMERPSNCCEELYEIMLSCWKERPRERPTFSELCRKLDGLLERASSQQYLKLNTTSLESPTTSLLTVEHPSSGNQSNSFSGDYCNIKSCNPATSNNQDETAENTSKQCKQAAK